MFFAVDLHAPAHQKIDRILRTPFLREYHSLDVRTVFEQLLLVMGTRRTVSIFLTNKIRHVCPDLEFDLFAFTLVLVMETVYGCHDIAVFAFSVVVRQQVTCFPRDSDYL